MTNITSECRSANIVRDHATILPDDATPKPDGIFGKDISPDSGEIAYHQVMQARIEGEIALVLAKPLDRERHTVEDVAGATDHIVAAFEIVGSRIANWDIKIADTVADNASSGRFVLGGARKRLAASTSSIARWSCCGAVNKSRWGPAPPASAIRSMPRCGLPT
jgi:2-keto-4-pentenoate hydratase